MAKKDENTSTEQEAAAAPVTTREAVRAAIAEQREKAAKEETDKIEKTEEEVVEKTDKKEVKAKKEPKAEDAEIEDTEEDEKEVKESKEVKEAKESKKTKKEDKSDEVEVSDKVEETEEDKEAKKEKAPKEFVPLGLPKEVRAKWSDIPSEAQVFIARTQKEFNDLKSQVGHKMASYRDMDTVLAPYLPKMQSIGTSPAVVVQRLLQYSDALAGPQKYAAIQQLAHDFGIDLAQFGGNNSQQDQEDDPALQQYVPPYDDALHQKVDAIIQEFNSTRQAQQSANDQMAEKAVNSWAGLDPSTGDYKSKPYFPYVRQSMFQLITNGTVPIVNGQIDLDAAYDMACYLNPEIRERQAEESVAARVAKKKATNVVKVQQAKNAGSSIKTGARLASEPTKINSNKNNSHTVHESVRDSLRRAITEINQ